MMSQHLLHARHATLLEPAVCPLANGNRHTYTHTRAYTVTHTLTGKPGLKRLKACLCRHGVADLVDSLRSYPTPFRVASSPNKSPRMLLDVHSFT